MSSNYICVVACTGTVSFVAEYCHIDILYLFFACSFGCGYLCSFCFAYYEYYNYEHFVYMFSFLLCLKHLMVLVRKFLSLIHFCMWCIVGVQFHSLICGYLVEQYLIVKNTNNNFFINGLGILVRNTYKSD